MTDIRGRGGRPAAKGGEIGVASVSLFRRIRNDSVHALHAAAIGQESASMRPVLLVVARASGPNGWDGWRVVLVTPYGPFVRIEQDVAVSERGQGPGRAVPRSFP